jgi:acetyl-CoA C-acetyltransferase
LLESGQTALSGKQPVNPSGGIISGVPALIGGLYTVAEGYYQLRDEAGKRQVKKARTALAHGTVGACGQMHCVIILGN